MSEKAPDQQPRQNHKAISDTMHTQVVDKTKAINRSLHMSTDNRSRKQHAFSIKGTLSEGFNLDHKIQALTKPKQQQRSKNVVLRLKQDFHESKGNSLTRKPFQKGGLLAGNLKQGTVTVQNRMIPRRPIIRVSPIQRRISNLFNDTF